jgi:hypothetical protein
VFTEALMTDLRVNAPHVHASVVMPGHIGTSIVENSYRHGVADVDEEAAGMVEVASTMFREHAPTTAAAAATVILGGVRENRWRILVGDDAHELDEAVRANPEKAYDGTMAKMLFGALQEARAAREPD